MNTRELLFLAHFLGSGRSAKKAAAAAGIDIRTAQRWLTPQCRVGAWLAEEAMVSFQTVTAARDQLENLLVENLVEGLSSEEEVLKKEKAADLTARVLGLDRGGSEHDISPETRSLFADMALAFAQVAVGGKTPGVEEDGVSTE